MTVEEKAKAYDVAVEKAKDYYDNPSVGVRKMLGGLFPENFRDQHILDKIKLQIDNGTDDEKTEMFEYLDTHTVNPDYCSVEEASKILLNALKKTPYNNKPVTDAQTVVHELLTFFNNPDDYNPNSINEDNILPKFDVGDVLKRKVKGYLFVVDKIVDDVYISKTGSYIHFRDQDKWQLNEYQEVFEIEEGKHYFCIKDFYSGGRKRASKGDVVQALNGLSIMGASLETALEHFRPVNKIDRFM